MEAQTSTGEKKGFLQNDRMLVCGMLVVYGVCILIAVGAAFWGLNRRNRVVVANKTATAVAASTQQAQASATAAVRLTEQAGFDFIETFDSSRFKWRANYENNDYWRGYTKIEDGMYLWDVLEVKDTFISKADFPGNNYFRDFDVYVDTRITDTGIGAACSGLLFRVSPTGWDHGAYYFSLCNDSWMKVSFHSREGEWDDFVNLRYDGYSNGWNRLEVVARDSHFQFFINSDYVYEMDDNQQDAGGFALAVEMNEQETARIWFDNFGFQRR